MFDKKIDVVAAMREIKQHVIPKEEWSIYEEWEYDGKFEELKLKIEHNYTRMAELGEHVKNYLETGYFIPSFNRFPGIIRGPLRLIAKIVARLTRFITREQNCVNHDLNNCINILMQNQQYVLQQLEEIEDQISEIKETI